MDLGLGVLTVISAVLPLGIAFVGKEIIDAVVAHDGRRTLEWVLAELGLVVASALALRSLGLMRQLLGARLGLDINVKILQKALSLDLRHFEDPDFYDQLTRARREASSRPISVVTESFQLVQNVLTLAGYIGLWSASRAGRCWAWSWRRSGHRGQMRFSALAFRLRNWRSPDSRRLLYLEYVLANDDHAKEVKLFGLGPMLLDRYRSLGETFYLEDRKLAIQRAGWGTTLSLLATGAFYACYALMAVATAAGKLTLGLMTLYIMAFRQDSRPSEHPHRHRRVRGQPLHVEPLSPTWLSPPAGRSLPGSGLLRRWRGIRFEDVALLPGGHGLGASAHLAFIPRGQSLALVGQNGA
jgi:ATP-binding cassette subfamily B protein